jgi:cyclopropane-fatty-acyl-phospholipid synthase
VANRFFQIGMEAVERELIPDWLLRAAIRKILRNRLSELRGDVSKQQDRMRELLKGFRQGPIAVNTDNANEQHYEVPTEFFKLFLGRRMKYSACYWPQGVDRLDDSEEASLRQYCERAGVADGMDILELGCGWGSLSLWLAEHYPNSRILAVSNSRTQREYIQGQAQLRGFTNLAVQTANINDFVTDRRFDRVMSIEMFEHMRNYDCLMEKVASFLRRGGQLFVQIFAGSRFAFTMNTDINWMARYFFAGGTIPSVDLLLHFQRDLDIVDQWRLNGTHYSRTLEAWLQRYDARRDEAMPILRRVYGEKDAPRWWVRWRLFFITCSEWMCFNGGREFVIAHYLFSRR